jgi:hypothetical protein
MRRALSKNIKRLCTRNRTFVVAAVMLSSTLSPSMAHANSKDFLVSIHWVDGHGDVFAQYHILAVGNLIGVSNAHDEAGVAHPQVKTIFVNEPGKKCTSYTSAPNQWGQIDHHYQRCATVTSLGPDTLQIEIDDVDHLQNETTYRTWVKFFLHSEEHLINGPPFREASCHVELLAASKDWGFGPGAGTMLPFVKIQDQKCQTLLNYSQ